MQVQHERRPRRTVGFAARDITAAVDAAVRESGIRAGIAYVPEERRSEGLALTMSVSDNIALANRRELSRAGVMSRGVAVTVVVPIARAGRTRSIRGSRAARADRASTEIPRPGAMAPPMNAPSEVPTQNE